ncbi:MAG: carboxypeptidase regulatory-like domain-containing protein [Candidatus Nezhaarchaeota archaeon]|nr:carboxypeptidase regulatory-like domain-containing protein [Candidatus Nezhaarchaeota archaeon]
MGKVLVIDVQKCIGCMSCVTACKDEHVANDWSPYAKPQPDYGHFWINVEKMERGTIPKVKVTYIPVLCMHCDNAPCVKACPAKAVVKRADGVVLIDPAKCDGCRQLKSKPLCIEACPFNAIYFNEALSIAQKCTLCTHLLDDPKWKHGPRCVDSCPIEAMIYGDDGDPKIRELLSRAESLKPDHGVKPRVHYLNLPKPFISGCVVDPEEKEVVIGARVTALDLYTSEKREVSTDELGDFWFTGLEWNHKYLLKVEKEGYESKVLGVLTVDKDVNVGDVFLEKRR